MYRINTFEIYLPPLRDRLEDIAEIADAFAQPLSAEGRARRAGA